MSTKDKPGKIISWTEIQTEEFNINRIFMMLKARKLSNPSFRGISDLSLMKEAKKDWAIKKSEFRKIGVADVIKEVMTCRTPKIADSVARNRKLTITEFVAAMHCLRHLGYSHRLEIQYRIPDSIKDLKLPKEINLTPKGNVIRGSGENRISESLAGEIEKRISAMRIHLFEKGSEWHCFYFGYRDIRGEHSSVGTHVHYCSHNWQPSAQMVLKLLKQPKYSIKSAHISIEP
jgi:hypothetical protein